MKWLLIVLALFAFLPLWAQTKIQITLEHAATPQEKAWGLMGRRSMPTNHGMLFSYQEPRIISLWSFNCFADLDVAFLDENGVIFQISTLKAYPHLMDPQRPVRCLYDLVLYPANDPIIRFFSAHALVSQTPCQYALETNSNFFKNNNIKLGDRFTWDQRSGEFIPSAR